MFLLKTQRVGPPSRLAAAAGGARRSASFHSEARSAGAGSHAEQNQPARWSVFASQGLYQLPEGERTCPLRGVVWKSDRSLVTCTLLAATGRIPPPREGGVTPPRSRRRAASSRAALPESLEAEA